MESGLHLTCLLNCLRCTAGLSSQSSRLAKRYVAYRSKSAAALKDPFMSSAQPARYPLPLQQYIEALRLFNFKKTFPDMQQAVYHW